MIKLKCPRCRAKIKAEDEVMGQEITCPKCHHRFPVGLTADAATALNNAPIGEATTPPITKTPSPFRKWVAAHPLASAGITGTIILIFFASIAGTYFSRRGKFPPRRRMEHILAEHGYHKIAALPSIGVLRGRSLREYRYARDANYPERTGVKIWCDLEKEQWVKGVSAYWYDLPEERQQTGLHKWAIENAIDEISGIDPAGKALYPDKDGGQRGVYHNAGYTLELHGNLNSDKKNPSFVNMLYILRDKTWYD